MTKRRILIATGAFVVVLGVAAAIGLLWVIGPRNVLGMLRYDTRREGELKVGDRAPDVELVGLPALGKAPADPAEPVDPVRLRLREQLRGRPLVLVLGSFT